MKRGGVFIYLLLLIINYSFGQDDVSFKRYSQENGLQAVTIRSIMEDGPGFLWISTEQGINRFDGYNFKTFRHNPSDPNSILNNKALNILTDSTKNPIYFMGGSISVYNTKKQIFNNYSFPELLDNKGQALTQHIIKSDYERNLVWLSNNEKLFKFNPVNGKLDSYKVPKAPSHFFALCFNTDSTILLLSCYPAVVYEFVVTTGKFRIPVYKELIEACKYAVPIIQGFNGYNISENTHGQNRVVYVGDRFFIFDTKILNGYYSYIPKHKNIDYDYMRVHNLDDELWITTKNGKIIYINLKTGKEKLYHLNVNNLPQENDRTVYDIIRDEDGEIWATTDGLGLIRINPITDKVIQYLYQKGNPNSIWSNSCSSILKHSSGVIWVTFVSKGLIKIEKQKKIFQNFIPLNSTAEALVSGKQLSSDVRAVMALDKEHLLVASLSNLCVINTTTGNIDFVRYMDNRVIVPKIHEKGLFTAITKDKHGNIIIGTWDRKYYVYNPKTNFFKEYSSETGYPLTGIGRQSRALLIDSKDRLWIATDSIVTYINSDKFINSPPGKLDTKHFEIHPGKPDCITGFPAFCLFEDSKGNIWAGTSQGLNKISPNGKIRQFIHDPKDPFSLNENDVRHILEDDKGKFWIGTNGGGLNKYDPVTDKFIAYTTANGLPDDAIYTMAFDEEKNIWLSSNKGLAKFNPITGSIKKFSLYDGLQNYEFNTNAVCKMPGGELVFGGNSGVNVFKPNETITNNIPPRLAISSFKIFNKEVPLPLEGITVAHNKNNLTFDFTALSLYRNEENQYAYKMENFDKDWIYSGTQHTITYNNLSPGNYKFKVKASNSAGIWNPEGISYDIIILPPWWQTWWARVLFLILTASAISYYIKLRTKNLMTQRTVLEQKVDERTKELKQTQSLLVQQEKLASLGVLTAGIAHEIKNPLNFVTNFSDLSQKLIEEYRVTDTEEDKEDILSDLSNNLLKINKHGHRANSIVENMLQHSRAGKGEVQPTYLNPICEEYLDIAFHNARARRPGFDCEIRKNFDPALPMVKVVPQDFSRVMLNFYSNAFDAVKEKAKAVVEVSTKHVGNYVEIKVRDNGSGIPDHIKESIFQPFFTTKPSGQGTGLGLSISYDIIKAHGGEIKLESKENEFTEFTIILPV